MPCRLMEKIEDWFYGAVTTGVNVRAVECQYRQSSELAKQAWNAFGSNAVQHNLQATGGLQPYRAVSGMASAM